MAKFENMEALFRHSTTCFADALRRKDSHIVDLQNQITELKNRLADVSELEEVLQYQRRHFALVNRLNP